MMDVQQVSLKLPKFKLETEMSLVNTLQNMGVRTAFTSAADEALSAFDERSNKMSKALCQELDNYLKNYKKVVDDRIDGLNIRKEATQKKIDRIKLDMQLISTHNQQLKVAFSKLA